MLTREESGAHAGLVPLVKLVLELYRAAQETPVDEFPHLALAMVRALPQGDAAQVLQFLVAQRWPAACNEFRPGELRSPRTYSAAALAGLADHIANAVRINRAMRPGGVKIHVEPFPPRADRDS